MDVINEAKSNWPIVVGGLVGVYVIYKYMGSSSTAAASTSTAIGPTAAQMAISAQTASDQLHANVAMAQIAANQQTATLATQVGGTVAMAKIQQTSTDSTNSLAMAYGSNVLSQTVDLAKNDTTLTLGLSAQQTAQFAIASSAQTQQMQIQTTGIIGVINANNQVPLATINSNAMLDLANINHDVALTNAQVGVITAQNQVPISYFDNMAKIQSSMNTSVPLMVNSVSAPAPVAPAAAYSNPVNPNIASINQANLDKYNSTSQTNSNTQMNKFLNNQSLTSGWI